MTNHNIIQRKIPIINGKIQTDLFRKETSKPTAFLPSSAHPGHITSNIIYSLAFRILRICSDEEKFEKRLLELKTNLLLPRNYHSKVIDCQFKRVKNLPGENYLEKRTNALKKKEIKENEKKNRVIHLLTSTPHCLTLVKSFPNTSKLWFLENQSWKKLLSIPLCLHLDSPLT